MATRGTMECPICMDDLRNPRFLPCVHSFCLECIERHCENMSAGDYVSCPVCRHEFQIPKKGVVWLPRRTRANKPAAPSAAPSAICEVCSAEQRGVPATAYCVDCDQTLCGRCSLPHRRWKGGAHDVKPLDAVGTPQSGRQYCEKHKERIKIYCFDCRTNVCSMCCLESHSDHTYRQSDIVAEEEARSIDDDMKPVTSRIESFRGIAAQIEADKNVMLFNMQVTEQEIKNKGNGLKQSFSNLIDCQVSDLLDKLKSLKSAAEKEITLKADAVELALTELESFRTSSLERKSKGTLSEKVQAASDIRDRAKELLMQAHLSPSEYHAPSYQFNPANCSLLGEDQNFVGYITKEGDSAALVTIKKIPMDVDDVLGVTSLDEELFVLLDRDACQIDVYSINDYRLRRHIALPAQIKLSAYTYMVSCVQNKSTYVSDWDHNCVHRLRETSWTTWFGRRSNRWTVLQVPDPPQGLSVTPGGNILVACDAKPGKLVELGSDSGQCVREILLQPDIHCPWHGVQLTNGQFVVCHGADKNLHRVCVVNADGGVTRSYGGQPGSGDGQLSYPRHLAVDKNSQFVIVADYNNHRIVLLSPTLEFVRYITEGLTHPARLHLDNATHRLYTGQRRSLNVITTPFL